MRRFTVSVCASALVVGIAAAGCSDPEIGGAEGPIGGAASAIDARVRADVQRALRVVATCSRHGGGALDPACVARAAADETPAAAGSSLGTLFARAQGLTHGQICATIESRRDASAHLYYLQGALMNPGDDEKPIGVERIWDLTSGQAATFAYASGGAGVQLGDDVDSFAGFARGDGAAVDVAAAWKGRRLSPGGEHALALATAETSVARFHGEGGELEVVLGTMPSRESLSSLALTRAPRALPEVLGEGYVPVDELTRAMIVDASRAHVAGADGARFVEIRGDRAIGTGTAIAIEILQQSDGQPGAFAAAVAAAAIHVAGDADAYCTGATAIAPRTAGIRPLGTGGAGEGPGELDPFGDAPVPTETTGEDTRTCADVDGACEALFPGKGLNCTGDGAGGQCCRPSFAVTADTQCSSDSDCDAGQICARGAADSSGGLVFGCIDPAAPEVACQGGGARAPLPNPRRDSEITYAAFIPCASLGNRLTGCFTGDDRSFDYTRTTTNSRVWGQVTVRQDGTADIRKDTGATHSLSCGSTVGSGTCHRPVRDAAISRCGKASGDTVSVRVDRVGARNKVRILFSSKNPCVTPQAATPAIDGAVDVYIDYSAERRPVSYSWSGDHDRFPAWEMYINGHQKHAWDPIPNGYGPTALVRTGVLGAGAETFSGRAGH